ncbi:SusD/RagB family nutrient-binding outer membrane lipoprotein [Tellurirhabdus rosea]|uniref:SusD/RagB family nutrient-binding outer membrane lipoprotein n=1 Tax=Tellurirhabdus rosea TaxID=2674997 RepID=UPI0022538C90|nr:SusD/RagB family nutrient-binding outer membrane lipoprotein [Tellurirhabdus rosea]
MKKILSLCAALSLAVVTSSCNDFLDINVDPNTPSQPVLDLLLPATQVSMGVQIGGSALNRISTVVVQHATQNLASRFDFNGATFQTAWNNLYAEALKDIDLVIKQGTERNQWGYVGIAKLEKAYIYSIMVDLWGDVPFTEASAGDANLNPKFDKGEDVYKAVFALIDEGITDLNKTPYISPGNADVLYRGDRTLWIRMANSLKLKLLNQIRLVPAERDRVIRDINALIAGNNLISTNAQDFTFRFGTTETPQNRHPVHISEYRATKDFWMDQGFMERLYNTDDPRLRYYVYRQTNNAGVNFTRTSNGYGGRFTGDPTGAPADNAVRATFGIYPYGGLYDNNPITGLPTTNQFLTNAGTNSPAAHRVVATTDGSGAGIFPMITNAMVNFILAEAALTLGTQGNARTYLQNAITAHLNSVNSFVTSAGNSGTPLSAATITAFVNNRLAQFDAADNAGKLQLVMTEKYIALFGNGIESYNDYRRTGLPALMAPISPLNPFPLRFTYSLRELTTNSNAPAQNALTKPVFWDL